MKVMSCTMKSFDFVSAGTSQCHTTLHDPMLAYPLIVQLLASHLSDALFTSS